MRHIHDLMKKLIVIKFCSKKCKLVDLNSLNLGCLHSIVGVGRLTGSSGTNYFEESETN